ncbi:hypothetical protein DUI87_14585 [Hirundo rustica rustica]|uniref:Uncharacterized protein n=1 Tax=Hirundo rustica rustica TaxID=333673 RepID=A0A3M0K570_HIRRU|nr:hypothetical protein DUI87_14585 [Hirundo rustica rustica]
MSTEENRAGEGSGAQGEAERAGKGAQLGKEPQEGPSGFAQLPDRRGQPGGSGSAPREQGQEKEQPQAVPGEAQVGHQEEFLHGKHGQELSGAAQGGVGESPLLEVSKEGREEVALSALGWGRGTGRIPDDVDSVSGRRNVVGNLASEVTLEVPLPSGSVPMETPPLDREFLGLQKL